MTNSKDAEGLAWQVGVWDRMAPVYAQEVDQRFIPVVDQVLLRAKVQPGQNVLDLGTGTGAVALRVARLVGAGKAMVGRACSYVMPTGPAVSRDAAPARSRSSSGTPRTSTRDRRPTAVPR